MKDDIHRVLGYLAGVSYSLGARNRRMTTSLALEAISPPGSALQYLDNGPAGLY